MKMIKANAPARVLSLSEISQREHLLQILPLLNKMNAIEVSEVLSMVDNALLAQMLREFDLPFQVAIFTHFNLLKQLSYFQSISKRQFSLLFDAMSSPERISWFQVLTEQEQQELLPCVTTRAGEKLIAWSFYKREFRVKKIKQL